jgi:hypothetical protein
MQKQVFQIALAPARFAALWFAIPAVLMAAEWEQNTPYYEDDAWYDISEWLDGNDYNPTDEVAGRWDDEVYDWSAIERDQDNDYAYGYDEKSGDDNWYYDYYDGSYSYYDEINDDIYNHSYTYYDYDNDGSYDALATYHDTDADAAYDEYNFYSFSDASEKSDSTANANDTASGDRTQKQAARHPDQRAAKGMQVSGTVEKAKRVNVRNAPDRLVVQVSGEQGKMFIVDLGPANQLGHNRQNQQQQQQTRDSQANAQRSGEQPVKQGERISARGPMTKVGDKQVLMAQSVKIGNQAEQKIQRAGQQITGQVATLKTAKVRGQDHQLVILNLQSGKQTLVDLGPADKLNVDLAKNDQIQIQGVPVKVKGKLVFLANSVSKGGERATIHRMATRQSTNAASKAE